MKICFLIFLLALVFGRYDVFAKCPFCPEKTIKREATSATQNKKEIKRGGGSAERLQKKIIRKEPPISGAKDPFSSSVSYILEKTNF